MSMMNCNSIIASKSSKLNQSTLLNILKQMLPKIDPDVFIHVNTATRWLNARGLIYSEVRKGMYVDEHKRADVVAYQQEIMQRMEEFEPSMTKFEGPEMDVAGCPEDKAVFSSCTMKAHLM